MYEDEISCCSCYGYREGGEVFTWRGQTKQLKKLFQEWRVPPWQRDKVPLIYFGDTLAMIVGYALSDLFYGVDPDAAWQIAINTQVN